MKQLIVTLFFLTLTLWCIASSKEQQEEQTWCSVNLTDGSHQTYVVRGHLTIIPTTTTLTLTTPTVQTKYSLSNILSYHFLTQKEIDSIEQPTLSDIHFLFTSPNEVTITNIQPDQPIHIFSTNGTQYPAAITQGQWVGEQGSGLNTTSVTISLTTLPPGVYLITLPNTNTPAIKIVRK